MKWNVLTQQAIIPETYQLAEVKVKSDINFVSDVSCIKDVKHKARSPELAQQRLKFRPLDALWNKKRKDKI